MPTTMIDAVLHPKTRYSVSPQSQSSSSAVSRLLQPNGNTESLAKALGWFSIGLGLAHLLSPRTVAKATGVSEHPVLMRAIGAREIASGVGILSRPQPTGWLWSRVAGDAMDLAMLGVATRSSGNRRNRVALATAAVAGIAILDVLSSVQHTRQNGAQAAPVDEGVHVEKSIIVNLPPEACYRFWRAFDNFPRFMKHLESVESIDEVQSHWKAKAPGGTSVEWDAEITEDRPGELLAWRSVEGADVDNAGRILFESAPGGRGTLVRVELQYLPPAGKVGSLVAKLFGEEPAQQIDDDLRRFKQLIETGEIPTIVGQPSGPRSLAVRLIHGGQQA